MVFGTKCQCVILIQDCALSYDFLEVRNTLYNRFPNDSKSKDVHTSWPQRSPDLNPFVFLGLHMENCLCQINSNFATFAGANLNINLQIYFLFNKHNILTNTRDAIKHMVYSFWCWCLQSNKRRDNIEMKSIEVLIKLCFFFIILTI